MMKNQSSSTEETLQRVVGWTLLVGVLASCILFLLGALLYFRSKSSLPGTSPNVMVLIRNISHPTGVDMAFMGLLVLMVTPVARMIVLVVGFLLERDWRFMWCALAVLMALLISGIYSIG